MLPDTFGTTQFLQGAPDWTADWTGQRVDSKDPYIAGDEYIEWLEKRGRDPQEKRLIASDAIDVEDFRGLHAYFGGTIPRGIVPSDFTAPRISRIEKMDARPPHPFQRRLGHAAHERFSGLPPQREERARSHQPDLQST